MEIKFKYKIFLLIIFLSSILNLLLWLIVWKKFPPSDIPYAIRYSVLSGADIFGTRNDLLALSLFGSAVIIINLLMSFLLRQREVVLTYILSITSFVIQIFLLTALFGLMLFNGQI